MNRKLEESNLNEAQRIIPHSEAVRFLFSLRVDFSGRLIAALQGLRSQTSPNENPVDVEAVWDHQRAEANDYTVFKALKHSAFHVMVNFRQIRLP